MAAAFQDSGFAFQGTGQFAFQTALGVEPVGGHYWPTERKKRRDYREERDEQRRKDELELRQLIERAAGLLVEAEATAPLSQVQALDSTLDTLKEVVEAPLPVVDLQALQQRIDEIQATAPDRIIALVCAVLEELIEEIVTDIVESVVPRGTD
jgi:hypothetical protein